MKRHIRGLEDHEAQEKKRLYRDVRSPAQRLADALKTGQVQTGGIFAAGACLFLFPACATPLFCLGLALFLARCACVNNERLPFRMPLGLSGTDKGDPLPGRNGFATPEGVFFLGNRLQDKQELWLKAKDILTHTLLFGTTGSGKTETLTPVPWGLARESKATRRTFWKLCRLMPQASARICASWMNTRPLSRPALKSC